MQAEITLRAVLSAAAVSILLALLVPGQATAKTLYRCGNSFSETPCGGDATEVHVSKFNAEKSAGDTKATAEACAAALRRKYRLEDPDTLRVDEISPGTAKVIEYNYVQIIAREYQLATSAKDRDGEYSRHGTVTCVTSEDGQRVLELH